MLALVAVTLLTADPDFTRVLQGDEQALAFGVSALAVAGSTTWEGTRVGDRRLLASSVEYASAAALSWWAASIATRCLSAIAGSAFTRERNHREELGFAYLGAAGGLIAAVTLAATGAYGAGELAHDGGGGARFGAAMLGGLTGTAGAALVHLLLSGLQELTGLDCAGLRVGLGISLPAAGATLGYRLGH